MAQTHLYSKVFVVLIHGITELEYTGAKKNYRGRSGPANESVRVTRIGISLASGQLKEGGRHGQMQWAARRQQRYGEESN
jgi:hypothetical protein